VTMRVARRRSEARSAARIASISSRTHGGARTPHMNPRAQPRPNRIRQRAGSRGAAPRGLASHASRARPGCPANRSAPLAAPARPPAPAERPQAPLPRVPGFPQDSRVPPRRRSATVVHEDERWRMIVRFRGPEPIHQELCTRPAARWRKSVWSVSEGGGFVHPFAVDKCHAKGEVHTRSETRPHGL